MALFEALGITPQATDYIAVARRIGDTEYETSYAARLSDLSSIFTGSLPNGSVLAPALGFTTQPDLGIYKFATNRLSFAADDKHLASIALRNINNDNNTWLLLGTGEDITNEVNDTYTSTLGMQSVDLYGSSNFVGINIGNASITAMDQVTKTRIQLMIEQDKLEIFAGAGPVQFDHAACTRIRLPIPKTDVTLIDAYGATFSMPNASDVTGTVTNWACVYIPLFSSVPSGNVYGILFGHTPTTGASIGSKDGKDINITSGQGGSNSNINLDVVLNTSRIRLRNATKDIVVIGSSSGNNWLDVAANSTPSIVSNGSGGAVGLILSSKGTSGVSIYTNAATTEQFRVANTTSAVNYVQVTGGIAGTPAVVTITTNGSSTDTDIAVTPKGTGVLRFGTHSALAGESVTGYITIKDSGGTTRKIAVVS